MKKLLLTLSAIALGAFGLFAETFELDAVSLNEIAPAKVPAAQADANEETVEFTLCTADPTYARFAGGAYKGTNIYMAFEFLPANCAMYAGAKVTAISFFSAVNMKALKNDIHEVEVFIIPEAGSPDYEPLATGSAVVRTAPAVYTTIELDEPYTIKADEPFAVGYRFTLTSYNDAYIYTDERPTDNLAGSWIARGVPGQLEWGNIARTVGTLCIYATIKGDNLPKDGVSVPVTMVPSSVEPGKEFSADLTLRGSAANQVKSVEVEYVLGDNEPKTTEITLDYPIVYGQNYEATISGLTYDAEQADVPATFTVTKVNGNPNTNELTNSKSAVFNCFDFERAFPHTYLVEEGTGGWCGYCPRGIVMMDYLHTNYPETFSLVAIHNDDEMAMPQNAYLLSYIGVTGFPMMTIDRSVMTDISSTELFNDLAAQDTPSLAAVSSLSGTINAGGNVTINSTSQFLLDTDNSGYRYRMSYYIIENNVGPHLQFNYYSGGGDGPMGGWENFDGMYWTKYDDVARVLVGDYSGISGSIPASITGGKDNKYTVRTAVDEPSSNPFYVVAFIIDNTTGAVVNSMQARLTDTESGLADAVAESFSVQGSAGAIIFNGTYTSAAVYNLAGQLVATAAGESSIALPAGLYIVKAGPTTAKVIVK
ncbi:MAG: Omp28-related outer membrane protein [Bacteroidales bacterium]|nr:Omp28-related outer membrane protein [Bacteroidales bacterium]